MCSRDAFARGVSVGRTTTGPAEGMEPEIILGGASTATCCLDAIMEGVLDGGNEEEEGDKVARVKKV